MSLLKMKTNFRISYDIPIERKSWCTSIEKGCITLEKLFPPYQLVISRQGSKFNCHYGDIKDRQKYLKKSLQLNTRSFNLNNNLSYNSLCVGASGKFEGINKYAYQFHIMFDIETWHEFEHIFITVDDSIDAYTSHIRIQHLLQILNNRFLLSEGLFQKAAHVLRACVSRMDDALKLPVNLQIQ